MAEIPHEKKKTKGEAVVTAPRDRENEISISK
jgi:hypothetical protein